MTMMQNSQGTPCRIWIIRAVGKLIVFLHLTGLVRIRSRIAIPKIKPLRDTPHPSLPQVGEGASRHSELDSESHS